MTTIADIGEFGLIKRIAPPVLNSSQKDIIVGNGDDAAILKADGLIALTTDCMVEGDHFRTDWFTPEQIGMKAIEVNVSDVYAMGSEPRFILVSLALPKDLKVDFVTRMYDGMNHSCKKHGCTIVGGNMTHSEKIIVNITAIGKASKKNLTLRSGAKPGDLIFVSGYVGGGRAGLRLFQKGIPGFDQTRRLYLEPNSQPDAIHYASYVNSMEDISDGLGSEIAHICDASRCGAVIYKENIPIADETRKIAARLGEDEYDYALFGGEDFQMAYTVPEKNLKKITGYLIGEVTEKKGVRLHSNGSERNISGKGYDHFVNGI